MPKLKDVAEQAGLSINTVSRVLNNRGYISQKTKDKVNQVMKELNYQPNEMARALFRKRSNMIGLIVPTVAHPFFAELAYYLEYYADQQGYKLLLCNSNRNVSKEVDYIDMLKKNQVDAIIMGSSVLDVQHFLHLNLPIVSFDRVISEDIPVVSSDNFEGGKLAARLLIDKGCLHPVYIYRGIDGPHHRAMLAGDRGQGYEAEMWSAGMEPLQLQLDTEGINCSENNAAIILFLQEHPEIDGVFASNDVIAAEVIHACYQLKKDIPAEIKIVGYDDVQIASLISPRLSTVRQPIRDMSDSIIQLVVKQIEGGEVPMVNTFPVTLIERGTT
ncbi:LacI family DNA-binding transcriptional regulator [Paenibacillus monticola]|uniref:LacI family DNA-binding transcriptional regulator n=1 Tax=Paenibacillus monticola TaxID=2666075 RepID=A0A7X2H1X0_9BACL|nr:LacI family DNA-binding transcriptional regulator [Paenibacillus monticola]MRN52047.1 LacI family DNA-binding transcriptional regulator [Paenibacillus monticola]